MSTKTLRMKLTSVVVIAAMIIAALGFVTMTRGAAYAAENEITVYVTVSNAGELAVDGEENPVVNYPVAVAADASGLATVDAALKAFHEEYYPGGYATSESAYGLAVDKLWGVENGGSYLFAIDGIKCNSGVGYDYIGDGQSLTAVVMKDLVYWADLIADFDKDSATAKVGEEVELTLSYDEVTYDENWNPAHTAKAVVGANVFVAGMAEDVLAVTDEAGKAVVSFAEAGTYIVTASGAVTMQVQDWSQGGALVDADAPISAPACVITVEAEETECVHEYKDGVCTICGEDDPDYEAPVEEEEQPADDEETTDGVEDETVQEPDEEESVTDTEEPETQEPATGDSSEEETESSPATGDAAQMMVYFVVLLAASKTAVVIKKQK